MPEGIFRSPALPFVGKLPRLSKARLPYLHNENKDSSTSLWECVEMEDLEATVSSQQMRFLIAW